KRAFLGEFAVPATEEGRVALPSILQPMEEDRDVWLGYTWWSAGPWWGDHPFSIEPRNGVDKPQLDYLDPHLFGGIPTLELTFTDVHGVTRVLDVAPGERIQLVSGAAGDIATWQGDTVWLDDAGRATTMLTMPVKD